MLFEIIFNRLHLGWFLGILCKGVGIKFLFFLYLSDLVTFTHDFITFQRFLGKDIFIRIGRNTVAVGEYLQKYYDQQNYRQNYIPFFTLSVYLSCLYMTVFRCFPVRRLTWHSFGLSNGISQSLN